MADKSTAQLDAEIQAELDSKLIAAWKRTGSSRYSIPYGSDLYWALARDDNRRRDAAKAKKDAAKAAKVGKVGNVTHLNVFTLANFVVKHGGHVKMPNQIEATERNGLKRCIDGGYLEVIHTEGSSAGTGGKPSSTRYPSSLRLTRAGLDAVVDHLVAEIDRETKSLGKPHADPYYRTRSEKNLRAYESAIETLAKERQYAS